ncbi:MAG: pyridoxamine 5-phosphate oxidase [Frankiaceae bacterium]|jgi:pyridoxamine 5'-phosphate oxidase|nr:pyridoxamine 5-phosphate oxidase [Frankiaceae bacterium]
MDSLDLARLRREYSAAGLAEPELPAAPMQLWHRWLADAVAAELAEANAMVLSTVGADGAPSSRLVLCKGADDAGFVFFTNYGSRKGLAIGAEPRVALLFPWHALGRQVRVEGTAAKTSYDESSAYFASRPRGAQMSAAASRQSTVVPSRASLEEAVAAVASSVGEGAVPLPDDWGGYRVVPHVVEFWQGRPDRLHDRLVYRRTDAFAWTVERLAP